MAKEKVSKFRKFFRGVIGTSSKKTNAEFKVTERALYSLFVTAFWCVLIVLAIGIGFTVLKYFSVDFLNGIKINHIGALGDFFGGTLNPILTFLTFVGLLITIVLQQAELSEARKEFKKSANALELQNKSIKRQSFESTFFQMLTLHNTIIDNIEFSDKRHYLLPQSQTKVFQGRQSLREFNDAIKRSYYDVAKARNYQKGNVNNISHIQEAYKDFWKDYGGNLSHYFRYLYNIIRFVKEGDFCEESYLRLIRAQFTDQELFLLFYNCLTPQGENFKVMLEKLGVKDSFAFFNNLSASQLIEPSHYHLMDKSVFVKGG
tara:strand:- start:5670 stop:6623 length:954 start_codon:yes stop_codon:yes gene_type:complete